MRIEFERRRPRKRRKQSDFSKQLISDIRALLWVVTVGGLLLAAYCIRTGYAGALPWLTAMVGLPSEDLRLAFFPWLE